MSEQQKINDTNMQNFGFNKPVNQIENKIANDFNAEKNIQSNNACQIKNDINNIFGNNESDVLAMANNALLMANQTCNTMNMQKVAENTSNYVAIQDIKSLLEKVIINIVELNDKIQNNTKDLLPVIVNNPKAAIVLNLEEVQKPVKNEEEYNKILCNDIYTENAECFKTLLDISSGNITDNLRKKLENREDKARKMIEEKTEKILGNFSVGKIEDVKNYILKIAARSPKILSMYDIQKYVGIYVKEINKRSQIINEIYIEYPEILNKFNNIDALKIKNYVLDKYAFDVLSTISVKNVESWVEESSKIVNNINFTQREITIKTEAQQEIEKALNRSKKLLKDFDYASEVQIKNEIVLKNKKSKIKKITSEYLKTQIDKALEKGYIQPLSEKGRKRKTSVILDINTKELFAKYDCEMANRIKEKVINKSITNTYAISVNKLKEWIIDANKELEYEDEQREIDEIINLISKKFNFVTKLERNVKSILVQDYKDGNIGLDEISRREFDNYVFDKVIKTGEISNKKASNFVKECFNIQIEKNNEYAISIFEKLIELKSKNLNLNFNVTNKNNSYWSESTDSLFITNNMIKWEDCNLLFYQIGKLLCSIALENNKCEDWENNIFSARNYYRDDDRNLKMNKKLKKIERKNQKEAENQLLTKSGCKSKEQYIKHLTKKINSQISKGVDTRAVSNIGLNISEVCHIEQMVKNQKSIEAIAKQQLKKTENNYYDEIWNVYNSGYNIFSEILDAIFLGRSDISKVYIPRGKGRAYYEKKYDGSDRQYEEILNIQFYEVIACYCTLKMSNDKETLYIVKENFGKEFCNILEKTARKFL